MKRKKDIVEVEGKLFQKSRIFGNWKQKSVFKNKTKYSRKGQKNFDAENS